MALWVPTAGQAPDPDELAQLLPLHAVKFADESVASSTTMQDDDALLLPVLANAAYELSAHILYTAGGAASANGIKVGWSGPAGATLDWSWYGKIDTDGTNAAAAIWMSALAIGNTVNSGGAGAVTLAGRPFGRLVTSSTAGTLKFRWAQVTSSGTATVVKAGSHLTLRRVG